MKKVQLFSMKSPYREAFHISGYVFGGGEKSVAIVGAMRGDEVQQQFVCSQLVRILTDLEQRGMIAQDREILVIPSANHFSMNIGKRFWPMDNTDINRMFPGYDLGETTQRIASALFEKIKGYQTGIQLASYHFAGEFVPHVRVIQTAVDISNGAKVFGMPYVYLKTPEPFDTVMLNYNWQIWDTAAYSIYAGTTDVIDKNSAKQTWQAIIRFLHDNGLVKREVFPGYKSKVLYDNDFTTISAPCAGIFYKIKSSGSEVRKSETIAKILDPYDGSVLTQIDAPKDGVIFFAHSKALIMEKTAAFQMI
ncbi:MAG: succinylglutamate desuccinylase/aspartoacylase family protein [Bacteroidales bacterium]|nr:succinylglutamate desuccinylase/aspartoacylase family protein [Bacteroidales bacterium]